MCNMIGVSGQLSLVNTKAPLLPQAAPVILFLCF